MSKKRPAGLEGFNLGKYREVAGPWSTSESGLEGVGWGGGGRCQSLGLVYITETNLHESLRISFNYMYILNIYL